MKGAWRSFKCLKTIPMTYYDILKQRRLDLNLSIQDVAIHTHLTPEYIRAIEDHNLDIFSDDFSIVRYFVHAYCDAIGVNWEMIAKAVDEDIAEQARLRDQALTAAHRRMIETMPSATQKTKTKRRKRKSPLLNHAASLGRKMNWNSHNQLSRVLMVAVAAGLAILIGASTIVESINAKNREAARTEKLTELKEKEQQTQVLADQLKNQKGEEDSSLPLPEVVEDIASPNSFYVTNVIGEKAILRIKTTVSEQANVQISSNGVTLNSETVKENHVYDASVEADKTITITVNPWAAGNTISINNKQLQLKTDGLEANTPLTVTLNVVTKIPTIEDIPLNVNGLPSTGYYDAYGNYYDAYGNYYDGYGNYYPNAAGVYGTN